MLFAGAANAAVLPSGVNVLLMMEVGVPKGEFAWDCDRTPTGKGMGARVSGLFAPGSGIAGAAKGS
jgi:hypothetical protein